MRPFLSIADNPGMDLRRRALDILAIAAAPDKAAATIALAQAAGAGETTLDETEALVPEPSLAIPGRPVRPLLVEAVKVPKRSPFTPAGRAALVHAIAHIEFNAINLALDAIWRFPGMPRAFYLDWLKVAAEEALHFSLLAEHLRTLGANYGDFEAHDGLWTMAERTAGDVLARMALVPRTLEARGLDATPPLQAKFAKAGDQRAVDILAIILRDEVGHVEIGNRWYRFLCEQRGLDPIALYPSLVERYQAPRLRAPFNLEARRAAGFDEAELAALNSAS